MATVTCLGCNVSIAPHDRRVLTGPKSGEVYVAWKEILGLKQEDNQERLAELKKIAAIAEDAKTGMLCRKCFLSLSRYQQLKSSLLTNIDLVISSCHAHRTTGFKRVIDSSEEVSLRAKIPRLSLPRRQLNFAQVDNQSPSVSVSTCDL